MKRFWVRCLVPAVCCLLALSILSVLPTDLTVSPTSAVSRFAEIPNLLGLGDVFGHTLSMTGRWRAVARHADGTPFATVQKHNLIPNGAETALRDCFGGTGTPSCTPIQAMKFHGIGTGATAAAETDTGCQTELTTVYNPDSTRATGSQTNNGANVYRTVGTNTVDGAAAITEFCLMSQAATGGGTMWSRVVFSAINLSSGDSLQTTYDLTIE